MCDYSPFNPKQATLDQALAFESDLGIDHVCIIGASVFGTDNACLVDALRRLKGKGRGIAYIDPASITEAELDELHSVGVRGIRVNLWTRSLVYKPENWAMVLSSYAERLRRLDWVIQIYTSMDQIPSIASIIPTLGVKVVFDHLGCPDRASPPVSQPGCRALYGLLAENKNVYIKLSGFYRLSKVPELDQHMRKLVEIAPTQVVWASDWPHTGGATRNPGGDRTVEQDFMTPDIPKFIRDCIGWCRGDEALMRKIWVENPRKLWDYHDSD